MRGGSKRVMGDGRMGGAKRVKKLAGRRGITILLRPITRLWHSAEPGAMDRAARRGGALIGMDLADRRGRGRTRSLIPLLVTALAVALSLAVLRIDLLRIRYAFAESIEREQTLLDQKRSLTARMRTLRDPVVLARRAQGLGFTRPDQLIDLPAPETNSAATSAAALAHVSAAPTTEAVRR